MRSPGGLQKEEKDLSLSSFLIYLLRRIKSILAKAAGGADPIFGDVLPGCAGGYTVFGIAQGGVINIAAGALVFHKEAS